MAAWGSGCGERAALLVEQGHAVVEQHAVDLGLELPDQRVDLLLPLRLVLAHAHGDAEVHPELAARIALQRRHREGEVVALEVVAGDRPPHQPHVDHPIAQILQHLPVRLLDPGVHDQVVGLGAAHQTVAQQQVGRRAAGDDPEACGGEVRAAEAGEALLVLVPDHHDVGRVVVGVAVLDQLVGRDRAHDQVAELGAKRVAHEAHALRVPGVLDLHAQPLRHQLGDLVLEALTGLVREREIVRIGADPQRRAVDQLARVLRPARGRCQQGGQQAQDGEAAATGSRPSHRRLSPGCAAAGHGPGRHRRGP